MGVRAFHARMPSQQPVGGLLHVHVEFNHVEKKLMP